MAGGPLPDEPDGTLPWPWASQSASDALHGLVRVFSSYGKPLSCPVSLRAGASGTAEVFRVRPGRSMHVAGASPLATELRRLLTAGAEPGWELYPVPGGRTPLHALTRPLGRLSGNGRFYNLLDRAGFAYVEEVAATPDECLADLRNGGPRFVAAVRQVISELGPWTTTEGEPPDDRKPGAEPQPFLAPGTLRALQVAAAWAVAEEGARTAADLTALARRTANLAPDVAAAWDHIHQLDLRQIAGRLLPGVGLAALAEELLAEVDQRRRLIVTARSFAPPPRRTYDSLAVELGVSRGWVRQLEADALGKLAQAAADDRYAALRWRAASVACPGADAPRPIEDAPAWMAGLLRWLPEYSL